MCWGDCDGSDCPGSVFISLTPSVLISFDGMPWKMDFGGVRLVEA
jgi:hypothetical protein